MIILGKSGISCEYEEYLKDESRKNGVADSISFTRTEDDLKTIITGLGTDQTQVTIQGARTGITAGACPDGGHILNLSLMNRITGLRYDKQTDLFFLKVQPGVLLTDIRKALSEKSLDISGWSEESLIALKLLENSKSYFFPPDPTETSASIGGMVSCNASGACSFYYGPTREYIEELQIILFDGSVINLKRGLQKANGHTFTITSNSNSLFKGQIPSYQMPDVKNSAGYFTTSNMDLIDLFIGSEGTLGVLTEIEIKLLPKPLYSYGVMAFFPSEEAAVEFVIKICNEYKKQMKPDLPARLAAVEYFNDKSLNLLRESKENGFSNIPYIPRQNNFAVYFELHGDDDGALEEMLVLSTEFLTECGGDDNSTWIAMDEHGIEKLKFFRHAVPEAVNLFIDRQRKSGIGVTKLSTDMAVPDFFLKEAIKMYNTGLNEKKIDSVIFGHIGNSHLHVNMLPKTMDEYKIGQQLYLDWARKIVGIGGTISAEHGIGKLKKGLLIEMYGEAGVEQMRNLKKIFDPLGMLNKGNMFDLK